MNSTTGTNTNSETPHEEQQMENLLASMVEMIKQREQYALETSFGRTVSRLTDAKSLTLYRLKTCNREVLAEPILYFVNNEILPKPDNPTKSTPISGDPALAAQLAKTNVVEMFEAKTKRIKDLILPLRGVDSQITGYCQVKNVRNDANIQQIIGQLLEFYQHFQSLLDDNERDNLTGLLNRKTLNEQIHKVIRTMQNRHRRNSDTSGGNYCLAMLDIDHFKIVNDSFGHVFGDEVLLKFANLMRESFRENDHMFRYGGEEFVVLLNNVDIKRAQIVMERFIAKVRDFNFPHERHITTSAGVTLIREEDLPVQSIHRADQALYYVKEHGRNQVGIHEQLVEKSLLVF